MSSYEREQERLLALLADVPNDEVNMAAINARVILLCTQNAPVEYKKRSVFIKDLAMHLVQANIQKRNKILTLPKNLKASCSKFAKPLEEEEEKELPTKQLKRSRCQVCEYKQDRKTKTTCSKCGKYICQKHCCILCSNCIASAQEEPIYDDMFDENSE